jgi:hypothetical protein
LLIGCKPTKESVLNLEIAIGRFFALLFDVLHDHFIGYIARTGHKVASRPYMTTPERATQAFKLHHHLSRCFALKRLNQLAYGKVRRNRNENMNMIPGNMTPDNLNIFRFADFPYQFTNPLANFTTQDRLAVFRYPNNVKFQIINGMAGFTIMLHTASILKSSPEGEGFSPIPRKGQ